MSDIHINRVKQAVASAPGTGIAVLGSAQTGFQALGAAQDGETVSVLWIDGADWEIATGCTYTDAATTLSRGTREDSSTGARLSLTSAAVMAVITPASRGTAWDAAAVDAAAAAAAVAALATVATSGDYADLTGKPTLGTAATTDASAYATAAQGTDAREWTAATVDQAEAEAGAATTRRAWTAQRVAQAIAAQVATWWTSISTAAGRALVTAADAAAQRTALGLGSAATTAASAYATEAQGTKADGAAQIAGDLGGTAAAPVVSKVNGVAISGTPTAGQVPTATSGTAATWQTPSGGGGSPGGSSGQVQYNNAGVFGGTSGITTTGTMLDFSANAASQTSAPLKLQGQYGDVYVGGYAGLLIVATGANLASSTNSRLGPLGVVVAPTGQIGFSSSANSALGGGAALAFSSITSGTAFEVNSGNPGAANRRDLALRRLIATEGVQLTAATVGTLPAAASNAYLSAPVSDASAPTLQTTVAAGGSAKAVVRSNGTNWIVVEVL